MALAVYGKHPAKGDFLEHGLPLALKPALEGWLDAVLAEARAALGGDWNRVWPGAPMLRFWIGDGVWGAPVAGVMAASQDRVGRRFPLVLLALGGVAPPVIDPDQRWYDAACAHLGAQLGRGDLAGPSDLLMSAPEPLGGDAAPGPAAFWAVRPGPAVAGLLADITLTDHRRASETRSYWWVTGVDVAEAEAVLQEEVASEPELAEPEPIEVVEAEVVAEEAVWAVAEPDFAIAPEAEPEPEPEPESEADASPFDPPAGGYGLFQPPEPGEFPEPALPETPATPMPAQPPRQVWSQVWAGPGLPSGEVLAWFFRGHSGDA